ncbi:MAG TPA: acyltransferase [Edaphobacter sp.]|nr:acyltransferase [Edaphobacter sp.]
MLKRIEQLDGIRAVAIAAVFLHHTLRVKLLWMGVDLFFILSGFLITGILVNNKEQSLGDYFGRFYRRRARRILPPYALLLIITSIVFGVAWARHWYCYVLLMNFLLAFHISHPRSLDILWSLAVEEQFYLFWPFAVYFLSEQALVWTAGAIFFLAPLLRWICTPLFGAHWAIYSLTPFRMDLLAAGALMAILWRKRPEWIKRYGHYGLALSALSLLSLLALSRVPNFSTSANLPLPNVLIYELTLGTSAGAMLWALSGRATGVLTLGPVRYVGRISYTVYLIHLTILMLVSRYLPGALAIAVVTLVLTLLYSALSWNYLEEPLLSPKKRPTAALSRQTQL